MNLKLKPIISVLGLAMLLSACGPDKPAEAPVAVEAAAPVPVEPVATAPAAAAPEAAAVASAGAPVVAAAPDLAAAPSVDAAALYNGKCASCHGKSYEGVAGNPKLAGLSAADVTSRLNDYRAGKAVGPKSAIMFAMAKPLSDEQVAALAAHLGK